VDLEYGGTGKASLLESGALHFEQFLFILGVLHLGA